MSLSNNQLTIVMYHYTRDLLYNRYPLIKGMDVRLFKEQLEFFKQFYNVVRMEQVIDAVKGKASLPDNALLLTFDDGYIDNYIYAYPILDQFGFQGSFFIPGKILTTHALLDVNKIHYILANVKTQVLVEDLKKEMDYYRGSEYSILPFEDLWGEYAIHGKYDPKETVFCKKMLQSVLPEKLRNIISSKMFSKYVGISEEILSSELYMNEDQIRIMKKNGMYIGVHGYEHYWLGEMNINEMKNDISKSLEVLDEFIDKDEWVMNYPYGSYNQEVLNYINKKGACIGLTTHVRIANIEKDYALELPRFNCNDFPPKSDNYRNSI